MMAMKHRSYAFGIVLAAVAAIAVVVGAFLYLKKEPAHPSIDEATYAEIQTVTASSPQLAPAASRIRIPILAYHIVRPSYPSDSAAVRALALTPETFDAELAHLHSAGYHVIGFRDLEAYFASSTPLPSQPVILSFDDGWGDQYEYAFPILRKYGDTATFFVFTNAIDHGKFLTWTDLRTMLAAGMTVGDHSRSHPFLARITATSTLWGEIDGSKKLLEQELGTPVTEFAYPFGQYDPAIISLVKQAGFKSARGDYWDGGEVGRNRLYTLPALNAPTTTEAFDRMFP